MSKQFEKGSLRRKLRPRSPLSLRARLSCEELESRNLLSILWVGKGGDSNWNTPKNWLDDSGANRLPLPTDTVKINEYDNRVLKTNTTVNVNIPAVKIFDLEMVGGELVLKGNPLTVTNNFSLFRGKIEGTGDLILQLALGGVKSVWQSGGVIGGSATDELPGALKLETGKLFVLSMVGKEHGVQLFRNLEISQGGEFELESGKLTMWAGKSIINKGTFSVTGKSTIVGTGRIKNQGQFKVARITKSKHLVENNIYAQFDNEGEVVAGPRGSLLFHNNVKSSGVFEAGFSSVIQFTKGQVEWNRNTRLTGPGGIIANSPISIPGVKVESTVYRLHIGNNISGRGIININRSAGFGWSRVSFGLCTIDLAAVNIGRRVFVEDIGSTQVWNVQEQDYSKHDNLNTQVTLRDCTLSNVGEIEIGSTISLKLNNSRIVNFGTFKLFNESKITQGFGTSSIINDGTLQSVSKVATIRGVDITNSGRLLVTSGTLEVVYGITRQTGGATIVRNGTKLVLKTGLGATSQGTFFIDGGFVRGSGTIAANVRNSGGILTPGENFDLVPFPGTLTISGDYQQGGNASMEIVVSGQQPNARASAVDVRGNFASISGGLTIRPVNYTPTDGETFEIVTSRSLGGDFRPITGLIVGNKRFEPLVVDKKNYVLRIVQPQVLAPPAVNGVNVAAGSTAGNTAVTITGNNFSEVSDVSFGGVPALSFSVVSATSISAVTPPQAAGTVHVTVTTPGGTSQSNPQDEYVYLAAPPPAVTLISPSSGYTFSGVAVTITGRDFAGATGVSFGSIAATSFEVVSDTAILAIAPPQAAGTVDVTVSTHSGTSTGGGASQFTYLTAPVPVVSGISPASGSTAGGTVFIVSGSNFVGVLDVSIGGYQGTFTVNSDSQITVITPPHPAGIYDVVVTTPYGTSPLTTADHFTYTAAPAPAVTALSPSTGTTAGGAVVQITGSNFTGAIDVLFGSVRASNFQIVSDTLIIATSPPQAVATVDVTVSTFSGNSAASVASRFIYTAAPVPAINGVSPNTGTTAGGTVVRITGSNFTGATGVSFGTIAASDVTIVSDSLITATAPPQAVALVDIRVSTFSGTSAIVSADQFTYTAAPTPVVSAISPASGRATGGAVVVITGSNFTGATGVMFGAVTASFFTVNSDTSITAIGPAQAAGTVHIKVTTYSGTSAEVSADQFTYNAVPAPAITALSVTSGSTAGGATLTITGTNFLDAYKVSFGGWPVFDFTVNSDTLITVVTPPHIAGTWDVTVTTLSGTSALVPADRFTYNAAPAPAVTALSATTGTTAGGTRVTLTGTNFTGAYDVRFGNTWADFTVLSDTSILAIAPPQAAGTINVNVTTYTGRSASTASNQFIYAAASVPGVTAISPSSGSTAGGTVVSITGSNFTGTNGVKFGTVAAPFFQVVSDTLIFAEAPPQAAATVDIQVSTFSGTSPIVTADQFLYVAAPTPAITGVTPSSGSTTGGTVVVITGSNFTGASGVSFGTTPADAFTVNSDNSITVIAPLRGTGTVDIRVTTPSGISSVVTADQFTYVYVAAPAPTVLGISPSSGTSAGGTVVALSGTNFASASAVTFGITPALSFTILSDSLIQATAPPGVVGTVHITVTTPSGTSAQVTADQFTYVAASVPTVVTVSPNTGTTAGGTSVTITGSNFTGATSVFFGGIAASSFTIDSATQITAVSPPQATGIVDVTVTTPAGTSPIVTGDRFTYTLAAVPAVTSLNTTSGTTAGGTSVTITGSNFTGAHAVYFGDRPASSFTIVSSTTITATSPPHWAGTIDVTVSTWSGTSARNTNDRFTYTIATAPAVTATSPTSGSTAGGTSVIITGSDFTGATTVYFGDALAASFTVDSATQITAVSPLHAVGVVDITVSTYSGTSATSTADQFTYNAAALPAVTLVSPNTGTTAGGTSVTITGSNFTGATSVTFGIVSASFTVNSATSITVVSPPQAAATVHIRVTTHSGTSDAVSADQFTYTAASVPVVSAVSPTSGSAAGGTQVTIVGSNFTGATSVTFGALTASFTVISDTAILATAPSQVAGLVDIRVTTYSGQSAVVAADQFTYNTPAVPVLTTISPTSGSSAGGTVVTITGSGFTGASAVAFGNTPATTFTVNSDTQITALAPPHAVGTWDVTVTSSGGTSALVAAGRFTWTILSAPAVTALSPTSGSTAGGAQVTITGTNFTGASSVVFGAEPAAFTIVSDTTIVATSPSQPATGAVYIIVTTPTGTSAAVSAAQFTYSAASTPTLTAVTPSSGSTAGTTVVTITGTNFTGTRTVQFGTLTASFDVLSDTTIVATAPPQAAGTVNIVVTTHTQSLPLSFTYVAASTPEVTLITPTSGSTAGGTLVTVVGSNFLGATSVKFGSVEATAFTVVSSTALLATAPPGTAGLVDITVTTPSGTSLTGPADRFTYTALPLPAVTVISPSSGSTAGGAVVTITGTDLTDATSVSFGAVPATYFVVHSATQITALAPPQAAGVVDIRVTTYSGTSAIVTADQFTYNAATAPAVTALSPTSGTTAGGTVVFITGSNFTGASGVSFGTTAALSFTVDSDSQIRATAPPRAAGMVDIRVTTPSGTSAIVSADEFTYNNAAVPAVTGVNPATGSTAGGTLVSIFGSNFTGATSVLFKTLAASSFTVHSDTLITAISPAQTAVVADIRVITYSGTSPVVTADRFTYTAAPAPTVTDLTPPSSGTAGGVVVTITGTNFTGASGVSFGSNPATSFTVYSDTLILATAPAGSAGRVDVTVTTPSGTSAAVPDDWFTYVGNPIRDNTGFTANTLPATDDGSVGQVPIGFTIDFYGVSYSTLYVNNNGNVTFNGPLSDFTPFNLTSSNIPPIIAPFFADVATLVGPVVTYGRDKVNGRAALAVNWINVGYFDRQVDKTNIFQLVLIDRSDVAAGAFDIEFNYTKAVWETGDGSGGSNGLGGNSARVGYANGSGNPGTYTELSGSGVPNSFLDTSSSSTSLVQNSLNSGGVLGRYVFEVRSGGSPLSSGSRALTSSPAVRGTKAVAGPIGGSTVVTILGQNFTGATSVLFGDIPAQSFQVLSSRQIRAIAPARAVGTVDIRVTTPLGTTAPVAAGRFTYLASPTVTSVSPSSGALSIGAVVTIAGTNFSHVSGVYFGTTPAQLFSVLSPTEIRVVAPPRVAGTADVRVVTAGGASALTTAARFTYATALTPLMSAPIGWSSFFASDELEASSAGAAKPEEGSHRAACTDTLTYEALQPVVLEAIARWARSGIDAAAVERLSRVEVRITHLPGGYLGLALDDAIEIPPQADGHLWFIDPTPSDDEEFPLHVGGEEAAATPDSPAFGRVDLLTVVAHELGHILGFEHGDAHGVMGESLTPGVRRAPHWHYLTDVGSWDVHGPSRWADVDGGSHDHSFCCCQNCLSFPHSNRSTPKILQSKDGHHHAEDSTMSQRPLAISTHPRHEFPDAGLSVPSDRQHAAEIALALDVPAVLSAIQDEAVPVEPSMGFSGMFKEDVEHEVRLQPSLSTLASAMRDSVFDRVFAALEPGLFPQVLLEDPVLALIGEREE